jgi:hypothetical protein
MTTVAESTAMPIHDAVLMAGVGGTVTRAGYRYRVGKDADGNWTLNGEGDDDAPEPLGVYVTEGWHVVSKGETSNQELNLPENATTETFLRSIMPWSWVATDSGDEYLWPGMDYSESADEPDRFVLISRRWLTEMELNEEVLTSENMFRLLVDEEPPNSFTRMAIRQMRSARKDASTFIELYNKRDQEYMGLRGDFRTINEKINEYADEQGMCSDYERRIFDWNNELTVMELKMRRGRTFYFRVPVRVPALSDEVLHVEVNSSDNRVRSPKEAREYVQKLSTAEVMSRLVSSGNKFDIEVESVPDAPVEY